MQRRWLMIVLGIVLLLAACGSGPEATTVVGTELVCTEAFCAEYPDSWELVDEGASFVSLSNPLDPDELLATVGPVNMEGLVTANGGTWPQTAAGVVEVFWAAADGGDAELARLTVLPDGSVKSFGAFAGGRMWTRLIPLNSTSAIGVELRGPNSSWETHADVLLDSVTPVP